MTGFFVVVDPIGSLWQQILAVLFLDEKPLQPGKKAGKQNGKRYKHYGRQNLMLLQPFFGEHIVKGRTISRLVTMSRE